MTHVATGRALTRSPVDKRTAHRLAKRIRELADWTLDDPVKDNPNLEQLYAVFENVYEEA